MVTRLESKLAQTHVALTSPTRQQVLQLMVTRLESKLAQTHVALTGPTRQQVLQLMMAILESKLSQTHVALTGSTKQHVLQLMMTRLEMKFAQTHVALTGLTRQKVLQLMMTRLKTVCFSFFFVNLQANKPSLCWKDIDNIVIFQRNCEYIFKLFRSNSLFRAYSFEWLLSGCGKCTGQKHCVKICAKEITEEKIRFFYCRSVICSWSYFHLG